MTVQHPFRITAPAIVATFREASDARDGYRAALLAACEAVHPQARPYARESRLNGRVTVEGLVTEGKSYKGLDPVPEAWRWVDSRDCYRPRQGKVGQPARDWLAALPKSPPHPLNASLEGTGLPGEVWIGNRIFWPGAWLDGDTLWIYYGTRLDAAGSGSDGEWDKGPGVPELPDGVAEAKLSEFHAAREAADARGDEAAA